MKKQSVKHSPNGMRDEYRLDYKQARPNRFASKMKGGIAVVLDPDVAVVFNSTRKVNQFLRSTIKATVRKAA